MTLQLASLVAAQTRLGHLVDRWSWAVVGTVVALGLASIVVAVDLRSGPDRDRLQPS